MQLLVSCGISGGAMTLCSVGVGLITVCLFFRGLRHFFLGSLLELLEHFSMLLISIEPIGSSDSHGVQSFAVCRPVVFRHPSACSSPFQVHPTECSSPFSVQPFCQLLFSALLGLPLPLLFLPFPFDFPFPCAFVQRIDVHRIIFFCASCCCRQAVCRTTPGNLRHLWRT